MARQWSISWGDAKWVREGKGKKSEGEGESPCGSASGLIALSSPSKISHSAESTPNP
ncbi:hypothetical protein U1Q18_001494, partial [Sarracenia purpurea var. burkii]